MSSFHPEKCHLFLLALVIMESVWYSKASIGGKKLTGNGQHLQEKILSIGYLNQKIRTKQILVCLLAVSFMP